MHIKVYICILPHRYINSIELTTASTMKAYSHIKLGYVGLTKGRGVGCITNTCLLTRKIVSELFSF